MFKPRSSLWPGSGIGSWKVASRGTTTSDWTRISVISPDRYQGRVQDADFWFPPNPKHFEEELKRVQITGETVEVQFYRAYRDQDHEITSLEVTDYNIKIIGN